MTREQAIIELGDWLATPPGLCLLRWEQAALDRVLADQFGFHALQLGLPEMDGLRCNRMPHRWLASDSLSVPAILPTAPPDRDAASSLSAPTTLGLHCLAEGLPFPDQSLDLVLMPHTLELARDPHQALAEAVRVLRPEGRLVVTGLNPASLWALRQRAGQARRGLGLGRSAPYLPRAGEFLGYWRLRDWLRLLNMVPEQARFGCYRMPCRTDAWLTRWDWMEPLGERWWPVLGAVYMIQAVKRVRGMRLVGLAPVRPAKVRAAPAVAAQRQGPTVQRRNCDDNAAP